MLTITTTDVITVEMAILIIFINTYLKKINFTITILLSLVHFALTYICLFIHTLKSYCWRCTLPLGRWSLYLLMTSLNAFAKCFRTHSLTASNQSNYGWGNNKVERCKIIAACNDGFLTWPYFFFKTVFC